MRYATTELALVWRLFRADLAHQRKRIVLTVLAIAWGTLSIVLLLSFGSEKELRADRPATPEGLRRKTVFFRDGQVVFASSTDRADRLGAVLWRHGQVPREELERCGRMVRPGRPLG